MTTHAVTYSDNNTIRTLYFPNVAEAVVEAISILRGWMKDMLDSWGRHGSPTMEQRKAWDHMICTHYAYVYTVVPGKDEPDEDDVVWDMEDEDMHRIGWAEAEDVFGPASKPSQAANVVIYKAYTTPDGKAAEETQLMDMLEFTQFILRAGKKGYTASMDDSTGVIYLTSQDNGRNGFSISFEEV